MFIHFTLSVSFHFVHFRDTCLLFYSVGLQRGRIILSCSLWLYHMEFDRLGFRFILLGSTLYYFVLFVYSAVFFSIGFFILSYSVLLCFAQPNLSFFHFIPSCSNMFLTGLSSQCYWCCCNVLRLVGLLIKTKSVDVNTNSCFLLKK